MKISKNRIDFTHLPFEEHQMGAKQKIFSEKGKQIRILKFSEDFVEENWCTKAHVGYVLKGEMTIDFDGKIEKFKKGDGIWIESGENFKHKVCIEKGKEVELVLFEDSQ